MGTLLHRLRGKLEANTQALSFLGDTRITLLEAIDRHGSINIPECCGALP
jgi:molybdate transport system regulatory protein